MKNFVITIRENEKSVASATKCIESGARYGMDIDYYEATTPNNSNIRLLLEEYGIPETGFNEVYSRLDNCIAAFLSHLSLWQMSAETNEDVTIFEHDAIIMEPIPNVEHNGCISFGKPSYGKFNTPLGLGRNKLVSKQYFPGAHAYRVRPNAAKILVETAKTEARPTDVYLHNDRFPFLEEYYPWPVEVREWFSTIQKEQGCLAKHMFNHTYKLEKV